jgi:hypothetical protein
MRILTEYKGVIAPIYLLVAAQITELHVTIPIQSHRNMILFGTDSAT